MATSTLLPDGTAAAVWPTVSGGTRPGVVQTNDGDASYVRIGRLFAGRDRYTLDDMGLGVGSVSNVQAAGVVRKDGTGSNSGFAPGIHYNGSTGEATPSGGYTSTYSLLTHNLASAPDGSGAWDKTKVNAAEVTAYNDGTGSGNSIRCTQCYAVVTYTPSNAVFVKVAGYLVPLLGAAPSLAALQRAAVAACASHGLLNSRTVFDESELLRVLEAVRRARTSSVLLPAA